MGNASEKYTEEQKKYYMTMFEKISAHKDFGKRNPVDIGIERGYTEAEVLGMIQMLKESQCEGGQNETSKGTYYFLLESGSDAIVVLVNIETWTAETVKKIDGFCSGVWWKKWKIKNNILGWTVSEPGEILWIPSIKIFCWEDLKTGKQKKILTDENIKNFLLGDTDIYILTEHEILVFGYDGNLKKRKEIMGPDDLMFEENHQIYLVGGYEVIILDSECNEKEQYRSEYPWNIKAVEYFEGKLSWYTAKKNVYIFSDNTWSYRKYTEGSDDSSYESTGLYGETSGLYKGAFTEHYRLLQKEIWTIDNKYRICEFDRGEKYENNQGVIAIPDKDIFIGITDKNEIIKIDLRNERRPVILPVH